MFVGLGLCYLLFIVGLIVFFVLLRPYSKLLRQAKRNDRIRYEEKIRYNERKRLELCDNQEISRKAVEETIREEDWERCQQLYKCINAIDEPFFAAIINVIGGNNGFKA